MNTRENSYLIGKSESTNPVNQAMTKYRNHPTISESNYAKKKMLFGQFRVCNLVLPGKNLKNKDFASVTQIYKLLVWNGNIVKTYIIVT